MNQALVNSENWNHEIRNQQGEKKTAKSKHMEGKQYIIKQLMDHWRNINI